VNAYSPGAHSAFNAYALAAELGRFRHVSGTPGTVASRLERREGQQTACISSPQGAHRAATLMHKGPRLFRADNREPAEPLPAPAFIPTTSDARRHSNSRVDAR